VRSKDQRSRSQSLIMPIQYKSAITSAFGRKALNFTLHLVEADTRSMSLCLRFTGVPGTSSDDCLEDKLYLLTYLLTHSSGCIAKLKAKAKVLAELQWLIRRR